MVKRRNFDFIEAPDVRFPMNTGGPAVLRDFMLGGAPGAQVARAHKQQLKRQSPPMHLKDEVIFLLHTAAEIEHALMAQYLYAAYSLPQGQFSQVIWRSTLLGIAKEEMGHLMSAQNLLLALGAPLNFDREDHPFNELYPYPFELAPLSVQSLARYVLAEMPEVSLVPPDMGFDLALVQQDAKVAEDGVNRVGALFELLGELAAQLDERDIVAGSPDYQADPAVWRAAINNLVLARTGSVAEMVSLIGEIGGQGEGTALREEVEKSHFGRLFGIYQGVKSLVASGVQPALDVPVNPSVFDAEAPGHITHPEAAFWADVFNHRYRCLLTLVGHFLHSEIVMERQLLVQWAFDEMTLVLPRIAEHLTALPQAAGALTGRRAAPPFELPYTLSLPSRPADLWRMEELLALHSIDQMTRAVGGAELKALLVSKDEPRLSSIRQLIGTN